MVIKLKAEYFLKWIAFIPAKYSYTRQNRRDLLI